MREIKFRVWDKKLRKMNWTDDAGLYQGRAVRFNFMIPWRDNVFAYEWELMQYTGLKDKNEKEIYEGDIVLLKYSDYGKEEQGLISGSDSEYYYEVKYMPCSDCNPGFWLESEREGMEMPSEYEMNLHYNLFEVAGNIYENPYLLAVKKKK